MKDYDKIYKGKYVICPCDTNRYITLFTYEKGHKKTQKHRRYMEGNIRSGEIKIYNLKELDEAGYVI